MTDPFGDDLLRRLRSAHDAKRVRHLEGTVRVLAKWLIEAGVALIGSLILNAFLIWRFVC